MHSEPASFIPEKPTPGSLRSSASGLSLTHKPLNGLGGFPACFICETMSTMGIHRALAAWLSEPQQQKQSVWGARPPLLGADPHVRLMEGAEVPRPRAPASSGLGFVLPWPPPPSGTSLRIHTHLQLCPTSVSLTEPTAPGEVKAHGCWTLRSCKHRRWLLRFSLWAPWRGPGRQRRNPPASPLEQGKCCGVS